MAFFQRIDYNLGMDERKCTHCGKIDISVELRELALIPGLGDAKALKNIKVRKLRRHLCKDCYKKVHSDM